MHSVAPETAGEFHRKQQTPPAAAAAGRGGPGPEPEAEAEATNQGAATPATLRAQSEGARLPPTVTDLFVDQAFAPGALAIEPDNARAMGLLAEIYATCYAIGVDHVARTLDEAERLARRATGLDPADQNARVAMTWVHHLNGRREAAVREVETLYSLNPNRAGMLGIAAHVLALAGEHERSKALQERAIRLNPHVSGWYYYTSFTWYFHERRFEAALGEVYKFTVPDFFGDPLLRAAVLGQLGRVEEAIAALDEVRRLRPELFSAMDGSTDLETVVRRVWQADGLADLVVEGLKRAGL